MPAIDVDTANAILEQNFAPWVLALNIATQATAEQSAVLRMPFSESLCRVGGILCGQALLSGADTAMVIALSSAMGGFNPCTTVDLTISYMRPITRADAVLEAKVMRLGRSLAFCTCEIREAGSDVPAAFSTGTYAVVQGAQPRPAG